MSAELLPIIAVAAILASAVFELGLTLAAAWRFRTVMALTGLLLIVSGTAGLLAARLDWWTVLVAALSGYRAVNLARILENRLQEMYARHAVRRTGLWLVGAQLLSLLSVWLTTAGLLPDTKHLLVTLAGVQLAGALLSRHTIRRQLRTTAVAPGRRKVIASDARASALPSLTVAIPARNEDVQLEACINSVLSSNYPKLEVIVLDDCSQDRTSDIIRSFAQAGVRFVRGSQPHDGWLAKNQAYDRLAKEASGSILLFCGVDVRFQPDSIRQLVTVMLKRDKSMVSLLPLNPLPRRLPLVQAMRYFWEMAPPRRSFNRPPVLSTCWLVTKASLRRSGGFAAVRRSVTPEAHFAKAAIRQEAYGFIRSDARLGVTSEKTPREQFDTAVQTRYPQLRRRPEMVLAVAALELALFIAPLLVATYAASTLHPGLFVTAMAALLLQTASFARLQRAVFPRAGWQARLMFVPAIISDIALLHYSMYKYEFSEVYWKGRNVCYPVMRVEPQLPDS